MRILRLCDKHYGEHVVFPPPKTIEDRRKEISQKLRELADRVEQGEEIPQVECTDKVIGESYWTVFAGERSA